MPLSVILPVLAVKESAVIGPAENPPVEAFLATIAPFVSVSVALLVTVKVATPELL